MNLMVTGGYGFIGSNFIRYVCPMEVVESIANVDMLTYAGGVDNLAGVDHTKIKAHVCDISDDSAMETVFERSKPDVVVNFAAQSHVDRSIKGSAPFIRTNVMGTMVLLDLCLEYGCRFVQVSCYDDQARALTTRGLKSFDEIEVGDEVLSINPDTREMEIKPVEKVIVQDYDGEMVHFETQRVDIKVTPNHRMLTQAKRTGRIVIEEASRTEKRSIFQTPDCCWVGRDDPICKVGGAGRFDMKDVVYIMGVFLGDGFTSYQEKKVPNKSGLSRERFLKEARDELGRFKKGRFGVEKTFTCRSYRVFFDIPVGDSCRDRVEQTLDRLSIKWHAHQGEAGEHIYFASKEWMMFFDQCGHGALRKRVPRWALELSPEYLRCLLDGLLDSDGHDGKIFYTSSEGLASDVCELCLKLGMKPTMRQRFCESEIDGRRVKGLGYYVYIATSSKSVSRRNIKRVHYSGKVWCLRVKDNANFVVERNGRFDFCGNTDEVYGSLAEGDEPFTEETRLAPNSPYSASKAAADMLVRSYIHTHGLDAVITRCSNNYGPYQFPEKFIPLFITNAIEHIGCPLYGNGLNVRDWIHVEDHCKGVWAAVERGKAGEVYNFGGASERRNVEIAKAIMRLLGESQSLIVPVKDRPGHDWRYAMDFSKASRELGWNPVRDFEEGLNETVGWYLDNSDWWKKRKHGEDK